MLGAGSAASAGGHGGDVEALRAEIAAMKAAHEERILMLEAKLEEVVVAKATEGSRAAASDNEGAVTYAPKRPATNSRQVKKNLFNPSIGLVFNGVYTQHETAEGEIAGFAVGHEGVRGGEGFAIDHTELNFSSTVDDKFFASLTAAIVKHEGKTEIELEEFGLEATEIIPSNLKFVPISLNLEDGYEYWLGFDNYQSISRYNRSKLYVMAVFEFSNSLSKFL